jgi:hypothetical protein
MCGAGDKHRVMCEGIFNRIICFGGALDKLLLYPGENLLSCIVGHNMGRDFCTKVCQSEKISNNLPFNFFFFGVTGQHWRFPSNGLSFASGTV